MPDIEIENRIKQMNPWIIHPEKAADFLDRFIPEEYVRRTVETTPIRPDRALLVVGPRQSGKSTMVWHMLRDFAPDILISQHGGSPIEDGVWRFVRFCRIPEKKLSI